MAMFSSLFCFSEAASHSHSSYKAASHCSDAEDSGFEPKTKFPEDLMQAFLTSCLDEYMSYERIQWVATVWPPGSEIQETEIATVKDEKTIVENEIATAEKEEICPEIDQENEATSAKTVH